jgi:cobalamin-dependent methionine synthase I
MSQTVTPRVREVPIPGVTVFPAREGNDALNVFVSGTILEEIVAVADHLRWALAAAGCEVTSFVYPKIDEENGILGGLCRITAGPALEVRALLGTEDAAAGVVIARLLALRVAEVIAEEHAAARARWQAEALELSKLRAVQRAGVYGRALQNRAWGIAAREGF